MRQMRAPDILGLMVYTASTLAFRLQRRFEESLDGICHKSVVALGIQVALGMFLFFCLIPGIS